jgi:hypothetical protein
MAQYHKINQLRDYVYKLCGCDTHGGRAVVIAPHKCILYDIPQWDNAMSRCVNNRFPSVDIMVSHASNSLTGFQVQFVLAAGSVNDLYHFTTFAFVILACTSVLWWVFNITGIYS